METIEITDKRRLSMAGKKIRPVFPDSPEGALFFAIVDTAIKDLLSHNDLKRASAEFYLRGDIPHAAICGVEADWIRMVLRKLELPL